MTQLHRFMEIDTCPMCGDEVSLVENGYRGKNLDDIPVDAVFEIVCTDKTGTNRADGTFRITKRDQSSSDNDWVAEYIPIQIEGVW